MFKQALFPCAAAVFGLSWLAATGTAPTAFADEPNGEGEVPAAAAPAVETTAVDDPDVAGLLASITSIANDLETGLDDLQDRIAASRESAERGEEVLNLMSTALEGVHGRLEQDSEIWQELEDLLEQWEEDMAAAQERAATDARWQARADAWADRIQTGTEIRRQLGDQATEANSLIQHISRERDLILEDYRLGEAQRAVDAMAEVGNQLTAFTGAMRQLADRTQDVVTDAAQAVPQ